VYQFPKPTWIENLAVRSNGQLLVTLLTTPELYLIDPATSTPTLIHKFPGVLGLTGIIEVEPDVFYVAGGNFNLSTFNNEAGSYKIWEVNMNHLDSSAGTEAKVKQVAELKGASLPNGFELLSRPDGTILFADSELGAVWKVNVNTGESEIVIQADEMKAAPPPAMTLGINGIKIREGVLFWSNTSKMTICRVKIDGNGKAEGEIEVLEENTIVDDFCFDARGNAWLAMNVMNTVGVVKGLGVGKGENEGSVLIAAGGKEELTVAGGTACHFGRGEGDKHVLYLVTTGGLAAPVDGEFEGGKVVAIDTSSLSV
jgi:hypothetical protein